MKQPCNDCPFRPRTFTPLRPEDVNSMLDEVLTTSAFYMYCHKDMLHQDVECAGSVRFRAGDQSGVVFKSEAALMRAHEQSRRPHVFHWRDDDCEDDQCR